MLSRILSDGKAVAQAWSRYECTSLSAAISFYAALSIFPLLLAVTAAVGIFFEFFQSGQDSKSLVLATISEGFSPEVAEWLDGILTGLQAEALVNGPIALATFLLTATLAFNQVDKGFDRIWETRQTRPRAAWNTALHILVRRLRALGLLAASGFLVLLVFAANFVMRGVREFARENLPQLPWSGSLQSVLLGFGINFIIFAFLYRFLSKRPVGWIACLQSALLAALLWEAGSRVLAMVAIGDKYSAYGVIGGFLGVLLWIYYNVMVLFLGAVLIRVRYKASAGGLR